MVNILTSHRVPEQISFADLIQGLHCAKLTNEELGAVSRMQHTVLFRYWDKKRKNGDPAYMHFLVVEMILAQLDFGPVAEVVGLAHDLSEDEVMEIVEVESTFGNLVAQCVDVLSKKPERKGDNVFYYDAMLTATANGLWQVVVVKIADRIHNLRTLYGFSNIDKEISYLVETREFVFPLATKSREHIAKYAPEKLYSYGLLEKKLADEFDYECKRLGVKL